MAQASHLDREREICYIFILMGLIRCQLMELNSLDIRGSGICVCADRLLVKWMGGGIRSNC